MKSITDQIETNHPTLKSLQTFGLNADEEITCGLHGQLDAQMAWFALYRKHLIKALVIAIAAILVELIVDRFQTRNR